MILAYKDPYGFGKGYSPIDSWNIVKNVGNFWLADMIWPHPHSVQSLHLFFTNWLVMLKQYEAVLQ